MLCSSQHSCGKKAIERTYLQVVLRTWETVMNMIVRQSLENKVRQRKSNRLCLSEKKRVHIKAKTRT